MRFGLHDLAVPEVSSHTLGISGGVSLDHTWSSGLRFHGSYDLFFDNDKDELDPDHIAIWWKLHGTLRRELLEVSPSTHLSWVVEYDGMRNTVSSIEFQNLLFPGVVLDFHEGSADASLKAAVGLWVLEIDDDIPKERGYARGDFRNDEGAYSLTARGGIALGSSFRLGGRVQHWGSLDRWLEDQVKVELTRETDRWRKGSRLVLSVEYSVYNLDPYTPSRELDPPGDILPILPWNEDVLARFYFDMTW